MQFPSLVVFLLSLILSVSSTREVKVTHLSPEENYHVPGQRNALGFDVKSLNIFCWTARPKQVSHYFETATLHLSIATEDFVQYQGPDSDSVLQDIENQKSMFSFNFLWSTKRDNVPLNVFNNTCIGVETAQEYIVDLHIVPYDSAKLLLLTIGVFLLFVSGRLSENSLFYYICGVSFGVAASFLILVYFVSKVFPRKALMYGSLAFGWSLVFYFGRVVWQNLQMLAQTYGEYLMYYCLVTGVISFIICYRYGPPTDKRSKNLIKWTLQGMGLVCVWASTDLKEAAAVLGILLLTIYYTPKCSLGPLRLWPKSKKRRLLTAEEFERQGAIETAKALEDLKRFCSSPDCNQWKTVSRLRNPGRFASFIEGESHLMDSEIIDHEMSELNQLSEDEDEEFSEEEESEERGRNGGYSGDHLISEEDDYEEEPTPPPPPPRSARRNASVRREEVYVSGGQRRLIAGSRFRAERTPPIKVGKSTPQSRRKYHLSDED